MVTGFGRQKTRRTVPPNLNNLTSNLGRKTATRQVQASSSTLATMPHSSASFINARQDITASSLKAGSEAHTSFHEDNQIRHARNLNRRWDNVRILEVKSWERTSSGP
ncbi:hypothetical protein CF319_g3426 [Tilletia indica]|nr:hypothetical protein CF319_g3426 [Tilletia indica]